MEGSLRSLAGCGQDLLMSRGRSQEGGLDHTPPFFGFMLGCFPSKAVALLDPPDELVPPAGNLTSSSVNLFQFTRTSPFNCFHLPSN